ncbi:hypothetical protein [Neisseria dumasiana]|uniref:Uncharacterized protein n=1 Tax=Neisseria dumasiana TaxID=1931275 RepID=A0ABX3WK79_9NEIS|nr:hypothetical protein [Neisseria dumasiana]OSI34017.1 hypothetical protein BV913_07985 [Neisseria dumasiana]UOO83376.1 hypothetical protein LVJ88_06510 [Neisseria dumasiana]
MESLFKQVVVWLNANQGVLSLAIFILTIILGWVSGIFSSLRRKPKFIISLLECPSFCCIYETGNEFNGYHAYRIGFVIYLDISNIGNNASSIKNIKIGYRWNLIPFCPLWWKYTLRLFWLKKPTIALEDFRVDIGNKVKIYPFLLQKNNLTFNEQDTFLEVGKSTSGVVYFEQPESWGGCQPKIVNNQISITIGVVDVFNKTYYLKTKIPVFTLEEAKKYNPLFGTTLSSL